MRAPCRRHCRRGRLSATCNQRSSCSGQRRIAIVSGVKHVDGVDITPRNVIDTVNPLLDAFIDATGLRPPAIRSDWAPSGHRIHIVATYR
jgi:hypothetical protein